MCVTKLFRGVLAAALLAPAGVVSGQGQDMGTAFAYQGELQHDEAPVNDECDFSFAVGPDVDEDGLIDEALATQDVSGVSVTDGMFAVMLDFGRDVFIDGERRLLQIAVCCPSACQPAVLSPDVELTGIPYSIHADHPRIYQPQADYIVKFENNAGDLTKSVIYEDPVSGNVGIGTGTVEHYKLHVEGGDQAIYGVATAGAYYVRPYGVVAGVHTNASLLTAGGFRTDINTESGTPNIGYVMGAECIITDDGNKQVRGLSIVLNEAENDDRGIEIGVDDPAYAIYSPHSGRSHFGGDFDIGGTLTKGGGGFKIDHPLDPANKYLYHSFVESPDMMNVYNGNVVLDADGEAVVELPDYFEALNRDFRYQLTAVGAPGPDLYIAEEISDNRLRIAGCKPGMKVSWQVTGIRQDPYANAHRIPVEVDKPGDERGKYLHPEVYGTPEEMGLHHERRGGHEHLGHDGHRGDRGKSQADREALSQGQGQE